MRKRTDAQDEQAVGIRVYNIQYILLFFSLLKNQQGQGRT
jgi:hypothetical protein